MKKSFCCFFGLVVFLFALLFVTGCDQKEDELTFDMERQLFDFMTADQIDTFCQEQELVCITEGKYQVVYDVECFGHMSQFFYGFDSNEYVDFITAYMLLYDNDGESTTQTSAAEEIQKKCVSVLEQLCEMHGVELQNNFYILDYEQYTQMDISQIESFQKMADGEAYLEFTMMDKSNSFWQVYSENMPNGAFFLRIEKHCDPSEYSDLVPNVTVK